MSDNIPFEIQLEIIKRLPIISLIQFRSVSKTWKSHIESSDLIANYNNNQQQHLLVRYEDLVTKDLKCVSIKDDDTFPQHKVSHPLPPVADMFGRCRRIIGSSHGLLCLYCHGAGNLKSDMVVLWNISIRKAVAIVVPNADAGRGISEPVIGFGVCPKTNDPKLVKIRHINIGSNTKSIVEVFTLSSGVWRNPYSSNLPRKSVYFRDYSEVIDGFIYWVATRYTSEFSYYKLVISFDLTSEEFREITLPDSLAHAFNYVRISKVNECLVVIEDGEANMSFDVWMMEDGVSKSFRKLYTIYTPDLYAGEHPLILTILGFRKSCEPIVEIREYHCEHLKASSVAVYEPRSKQIESLGTVGSGSTFTFSVYPYIETLLLLDHPDSIIYDEGKHSISQWRKRLLKHSISQWRKRLLMHSDI